MTPGPYGFEDVEIYNTTADLDPSEPVGTLVLVLNPLTLYAELSPYARRASAPAQVFTEDA
jgi:hypothetical protein